MALIKSVAIEIAIECKKRNIEIDYFKLQKLAYICQCVEFDLYDVYMSPEKIIKDFGGPRYNEIYHLFKRIEPSDLTFKNTSIEKLIKYRELINYDLLFYETSIVNFVIENFAHKSADDLIELTNNYYIEKLNIGERIYLENIDYKFISKKQKDEFNPLKKTLKND